MSIYVTHHLSHTIFVIHLRFAWHVWHLATSTFASRGKRGTWWHPPSFCVASVALMALGWLWSRAWARLGALGRRWRRGTLRGRRGTWWHPSSFRVAGMALGDIHLRFAWQAWNFWHWAGSGGALGRAWALCHTLSFTHSFHTHHLSHTIFHTPSFTSNFVTHRLWHTIFHTRLCHPPSLTPPFTHNFVTHHLWHHFATHHLSHTTFDTPNFVTHHLWHSIFHTHTHHFGTHHLWHTIFHTHTHNFVTQHIWHTALSPTIFDTPSFTHSFVTHHPWHTALSHTIFHPPYLTHHFVTHHLSQIIFHTCHTPCFTHHLCHTPSLKSLSHTIFVTQLCHTPSLSHTIFDTTRCHTPSLATPSFTHHFVTHHLSHTTLSDALFHTQLSHTHTPSFTHNFVTHTHHLSLSHTIFYIQLCHTHTHHLSLSHTIFHIQLCHTQLCFTSRSSTTSFVFPSFPLPATTLFSFLLLGSLVLPLPQVGRREELEKLLEEGCPVVARMRADLDMAWNSEEWCVLVLGDANLVFLNESPTSHNAARPWAHPRGLQPSASSARALGTKPEVWFVFSTSQFHLKDQSTFSFA